MAGTITVIKPGLVTANTTAGMAATTAGDSFLNDGKTTLRFKNTSTPDITVTINSQLACNQGSDHNVTCLVSATSGDVTIGGFPKDRFDDVNELVQLTYSATPTNILVWAVSSGG